MCIRCRLDVPRTQDAIPRPVHLDRALLRRDVGRGAQILVQKGVMLRKNTQTAIVRIIHAVGNVLHVLEVVRRNLQGFQAVVIQLGACLHKILQAPRCHAVGVPVVVHVIHSGQPVGTAPNITDAQVISQITVMNNDFRRLAGPPGFNTTAVGADTMIQFALAQQDPDGNPTNGINRVNLCQPSWSMASTNSTVKPQTQWDPNL